MSTMPDLTTWIIRRRSDDGRLPIVLKVDAADASAALDLAAGILGGGGRTRRRLDAARADQDSGTVYDIGPAGPRTVTAASIPVRRPATDDIEAAREALARRAERDGGCHMAAMYRAGQCDDHGEIQAAAAAALIAVERHRESMPKATDDLALALLRADRLIAWMSGYIGQMAPGSYRNAYADLNEHGLFISALKARLGREGFPALMAEMESKVSK